MALIDEQGRLFGRVNLIDALASVFVLAVVPLVYGAFLLFRAPTPEIRELTPSTAVLTETKAIEIRGRDLRPFLRAAIGTKKAPAFLVESPSRGEIKLPDDLEPGTYDVILFDEAQELTRRPGALTVVRPARRAAARATRIDVQVVGAFVGLSDTRRELFQMGARFEPPPPAAGEPAAAPERPLAEVLALRDAERGVERLRIGDNQFMAAPAVEDWRVPAILRLNCALNGAECRMGDVVVSQRAVMTLPFNRPRTATDDPPAGTPNALPTVPDQVRFAVSEVRPPDTKPEFPVIRSATVVARVRFVAPEEVANLMKPGDVDMIVPPAQPTEAERATLTDVLADRQPATATNVIDAVMRRNLGVPAPVVIFTGVVRVPVTATPLGWTYKERTVKVGAPFYFESMSGGMAGWIIDMNVGKESRRYAQ